MEAAETNAIEKKRARVLLVTSVPSVARRVAREIIASGGEPFIASSAAECRRMTAECRRMSDRFDHGIFQFDLPDGSGIVLAAELMLENLLPEVEFLHPEELRSETHASGHDMRKVSRDEDSVDSIRCVA